jgi:hypothetical protein
MIVVRGKVSGRVVVLERELPEGTEVDVRVLGANEPADGSVTVTDEQWSALMEAAAQARAGKTVDAATVLADLGRRR